MLLNLHVHVCVHEVIDHSLKTGVFVFVARVVCLCDHECVCEYVCVCLCVCKRRVVGALLAVWVCPYMLYLEKDTVTSSVSILTTVNSSS